MSNGTDVRDGGSSIETESVDHEEFESVSTKVDEFYQFKEHFNELKDVAAENAAYFSSRPTCNQSNDKFHTLFINIVTTAESTELLCAPLMERVSEFDLSPSVHANGFRSLLHMVHSVVSVLLTQAKFCQDNRSRTFFFSSTTFELLSSYHQALKGLSRLVLLAQELMTHLANGDLFPESKEISKRLLEQSETIPRECFYGQCLGIHYVPSIKPVVQSISVAMASFGEGFLRHPTHGQRNSSVSNMVRVAMSSVWHGTGFVLNHTRRAAQIVSLTQSRDIHFTKAFWSLSEMSAMQHMAELVIPKMACTQLITLPIDVLYLPCVAPEHGESCKGTMMDVNKLPRRHSASTTCTEEVTSPAYEVTEEEAARLAQDVQESLAVHEADQHNAVDGEQNAAVPDGNDPAEDCVSVQSVSRDNETFDVIASDDEGSSALVDETDLPAYSDACREADEHEQRHSAAAEEGCAAAESQSTEPEPEAKNVDNGPFVEDASSSPVAGDHALESSCPSALSSSASGHSLQSSGSTQGTCTSECLRRRELASCGESSASESTSATAASSQRCMVGVPPPLMHTSDPASVNIHLISSVWREGQKRSTTSLSSLKRRSRQCAQPLSPGLVLHCHGGGFVATTTKSHQSYLRQWSIDLKVPVVSIDYSLAPEHPFPRAICDCLYAYAWIVENCELLGSTGERIIITGDSAGGNLAVAVTLAAIEMGIRKPDAIMSAYAPFAVELSLTPSRLLSVFDPLLPQGVLMACLDAYATATVHDGQGKKPGRRSKTPDDSAVKFTSSSKPSIVSRVLGWNAGGQPSVQWSKLAAGLSSGSVSSSASDSSAQSSPAQPAIAKETTTVDGTTNGTINGEAASAAASSEQSAEASAATSTTTTVQSDPQSLAAAVAPAGQREAPSGTQDTESDTCPTSSESATSSSADFVKVSFADANAAFETNVVQLNELQEKMFKVDNSPFLSPLHASDELLKQLPHVDLVACALDPLLDDSVAFAKRLSKLNVSSELRVMSLLPHGFLNLAFVSQEAHRAYDLCTQCMRNSLAVPEQQ